MFHVLVHMLATKATSLPLGRGHPERNHPPRAYSSFDWPGLDSYRRAPRDQGIFWGPGDIGTPQSGRYGPLHLPSPPLNTPDTLAECCALVRQTADPLEKVVIVHQTADRFLTGGETTEEGTAASFPPIGSVEEKMLASTPARLHNYPPLVSKATQVPRLDDLEGYHPSAYLLHNLAHVELNAIDLACDTIARFSPLSDVLPRLFFTDFIRVADDEARHFQWCVQRLQELGHDYGEIPQHDLLWQGCHASRSHVSQRLAVVNMAQEARGLDAGHRLVSRLCCLDDRRSAAIVARIASEEKAHVAVGIAWFVRICDAVGIAEDMYGTAFREAMDACGMLGVLRPPFNHPARQEVGLPQDWYDPALWTRRRHSTDHQDKAEHGLLREQLEKRLQVIIGTEAYMSSSNVSTGRGGSSSSLTSSGQAALVTQRTPR